MGGGRAHPLVAQAAPLLVQAERPVLPLARPREDAVRGGGRGNPVAEDDRDRGGTDLPRVHRALPLVGRPRASAIGGPRERAQTARALAAKGAGLPAPRAVDRGAWGRRSPLTCGIGAPAGDRPLHGERGPGHRVRASRAAPRREHGQVPLAVLWIT